jgi:tRNA 2-thiocytidine biosynthesis protein TtcA
MARERGRRLRYVLKDVTRAIGEFEMIEHGDRVAVAVSGGKDSLAMLDLLLRHRRKVPYDYDLLVLHVVGVAAGLPDARGPLEPWLQRQEVPYRFIPLELSRDEPLPLDCFRCSWNRRKTLFKAAADADCNRIAFGHHADDAAATTLLNVMFSARLETLLPRVEFFDGLITLLRPLIYVSEADLARCARLLEAPEVPRCPRAETSQRAQVQRLINQFGRSRGQIRVNLWRVARRHMGF